MNEGWYEWKKGRRKGGKKEFMCREMKGKRKWCKEGGMNERWEGFVACSRVSKDRREGKQAQDWCLNDEYAVEKKRTGMREEKNT